LVGLKSLALALLASHAGASPSPEAASAPPAARATIEGAVEISTAPGVEPSSVLNSSDAQKALEPKLAEIAACAAGVTPSVDDTYRAAIDVDATGHVTAVRTIESHVSEAAGKCVDDALKTATLPALQKPDATATLTLTIRMKSAAEERAQAEVAEKAAEPLPEQGAPAMEKAAAETPPAAPATGTGAQGAGVQPSATVEAKVAETKPWKVAANLTQWLGQGTFVKDSFAATPDYGYLFGIGGSYDVTDKVKISSRLVWLQQLTVTNKDSGTIPRELLFRDLTLSASAPKLYKEENTGIEMGTGGTIYFPISKASRAQQRLLGAGIRGNAQRLFEKLGPGDLSVGYTLSFVKNFGPGSPDNDPGKHPTGELCRGGNRDGASGTCLTSNASNNFFVLNDFSVSYTFLEDWTVSFDFLIWNQISNRLSGSNVSQDLAAGNNIVVGTSPFATGATGQNDLTLATIELAYAITKNFTVGASLYTFQPVFIQSGGNSRSLRFPLWDTQSAAENYSQFTLDLAFTY
jgi:hypothetical protein